MFTPPTRSSRSNVKHTCAALVAVFLATLGSVPANAALLGPSTYSSFADSPFSGGSFSYFHLEDFDDHLLNTPGVTVTAGTFSAVNSGFSGSIIDQVGLAGGCPAGGLTVACDTWFGSGAAGLSFTFNAGILGQLPNAAGDRLDRRCRNDLLRSVRRGQCFSRLARPGVHRGRIDYWHHRRGSLLRHHRFGRDFQNFHQQHFRRN